MTTSIKTFCRQHMRHEGPIGDFARDTWDCQWGPHAEGYRRRDHINQLATESFYGLCRMLPIGACDAAREAMVGFWKAWITHNYPQHANPAKRGYVYFAHCEAQDIYKIGRTQHLSARIQTLRATTKWELDVYDAIEIDHYAIIEKELHRAFHDACIGGEWFRIEPLYLQMALGSYQETDPSSLVISYGLEEEDE